jgi:O-antigen biosynthesis protein WbqP
MYPFFKRLFDIAASVAGILVLSPLFIFLAIGVKFSSPGPVFFKQKRIGLNKKHFHMLKFRTMFNDAPSDIPTHMLQNPYIYITPLGRFLRKTSLDELPQLFNILRGDMTIVGPRPALWNQDDLVAARDKYGANDVRPGLTGLAQISGRDELPIEIKAAYDGEYIKKMSLLFDFKIIFLTVFSVAKAEGVKEGKRR